MAKKFGDWTVKRSLDEGGQAFVYLVENEAKEVAAAKRLKNPARKTRFEAEVRALGMDNRNYFPKVFQVSLESDPAFYVMEYFQRGSLSEEMATSWNIETKVKFFYGVLLAVGWANNEGVIHRDLKPQNILVSDDGSPRVGDFGMCHFGDNGVRITLSDEAGGSMRYMAPEIEDGRSNEIGPHTDVYSLGKIGYWLFSGGKIYNRERHREVRFDLCLQGKEHWRHYFNDFLDGATHPEPKRRIPDVPHLIIAFDEVRKALMDGIRYLDTNVEQRCAFCGLGVYSTVIDFRADGRHHGMEVNNFGFQAIGASEWLILACNVCGNVQSFRKDKTPKWGWKD